MTRRFAFALLSLALGPVSVYAQTSAIGATRRIAFDTVAGLQDFSGADSPWQTVYIIDNSAGIEIRRGWQVSVRPVIKRIRGAWDVYLDQLSLRYETTRWANWRFEAGKFASPVGLGMTELRASQNPGVIWWHRPYYMPLPSLGPGLPRASLVSAVYPTGASVSASRERWDARAAILDRPPVEFWQGWAGSYHAANGVAGFGVTPRQGLRIGATTAWGAWTDETPEHPEERYRLVNIEGDFAFGYTRISGEWIRDTFHTPNGPQVSSGATAQVQYTIAPRWFAHSRASVMHSPEAVLSAPGTFVAREYRVIETTLGFRLTPDVTLRVAHAAMQNWGLSSVDNQLGVSFVFARRWW